MNYLRLKKQGDFQKIFKRGERVFSRELTMLYTPSACQYMGIALSKRHGGAVKRNRLKRLVRAAYDKNVCLLASPYSIIVLPKVKQSYSYSEIEKSVISCIKRINSSCNGQGRH